MKKRQLEKRGRDKFVNRYAEQTAELKQIHERRHP